MHSIELEDLDVNEAKKLYRKLNTKSSYNTMFGEPPKAEEDYVIMKEKKFRDMDISMYFQDLPKTYIEKWMQLG